MALRWGIRLLIALGAVYLLALAYLVLYQRQMMYFPGGPIGPATQSGLPDAQTMELKGEDGGKIVTWYQPPADGKPLFLVFHGNGGALAMHADLLRRLSSDGSGFLAIDYNGYGGSAGAPTEHGLYDDGAAAYVEARFLGYPADRIVIFGESIGTAVAVSVAVDHPAKALILDSAFSSAVSIAAAQYPIFPVSLLMMDRYNSLSRIGRVDMPKLFLHGEKDDVIPIASDRQLYDAAKEPKTLMVIANRGHVVLGTPGTMDRVRAWLAALPDTSPARDALDQSTFSTR